MSNNLTGFAPTFYSGDGDSYFRLPETTVSSKIGVSWIP